MSDNYTNRTRGAALSVVNMLASLVIGLFYTPFLLRLLGQSEYGVYNLANSLIAYLSILDLGFGNALVRYTARARAEGKGEENINGMFLLFYLGVSAVALICGLVLSLNIEQFFSTSFTETEAHTLRVVFHILLASTVISFPASVFSSIIRSHQRFVFANTLTLVQNVLRHTITLAFLFLGFKSVSIAVIFLCFTVLTAGLNIYYCFRHLGIRFGFRKMELGFYKEVFLYSFFILINILVDQLYSSTDNVILGKLCGSISVAVYGVGVTFQTYFTQFSTAISGVFLPHISQLATRPNGKQEMSKLFVRVGRIQYLLLSCILLGFAVFGQRFIRHWAGAGYEDAYWIALLVMLPAIIPLSQNIGISVLQALNRHRIRSVMYLCIAVLNILISIPLAMYFGGIGAALGTAVGNLLGQILFMNWYYWKKIGLDIPQYWRQLLSITVRLIPLAVIFVTLRLIIRGSGIGALIAQILCALLCAIPYYFFFVLNAEEKELVMSTMFKLKGEI